MSGELSLEVLLSSMKPELLELEYVFITFPDGRYGDGAHLSPIGSFIESEGLTLIIPAESARKNNLKAESLFRCISLKVHSSLEAVGLTAAISKVLALNGVSANVVAGYFHDHVFVPAQDADKAMAALNSIEH